MPFQSESQRRYLWAKHPEVARRWTDKYGSRPRGKGSPKDKVADALARRRVEHHG
jgi:hypothetical protein